MPEYSLMDEIPERDATGEVASIYAEIRRQLPIVNLIWRHLATRPAALKWAWSIAGPLYSSGVAGRGAEQLNEDPTRPALPPVPAAAWSALGLSAEDRAAIEAMFRVYNRGNGLNLIALSAVLVSDEAIGAADSMAAPPSTPDPPAEDELPPLPALDELSADTQALVLAINQLGTGTAGDPIVASLYRHLGYWPPYLALAWAQLASLDSSGQLTQAIDEVEGAATRQATALARYRGAPPEVDRADEEFAHRAIAEFRATAICRMATIGLLLDRSLREPPA